MASTYANGAVRDGRVAFIGAAGMNSSDLTLKTGSAGQMIFRLNPQSRRVDGRRGGAGHLLAGRGHSFIHKGKFEILSIYPRAYRGVAGASSRNLFKNSPEAGGRHLFSENLKDRIVGRPARAPDAKPKPNPGGAGLDSQQLFKGTSCRRLATRRASDHDKDGDGIFDHLRDEEADIPSSYGGDLATTPELRKVARTRTATRRPSRAQRASRRARSSACSRR